MSTRGPNHRGNPCLAHTELNCGLCDDDEMATLRVRPSLIDQFGRVARDLRISVTDRCNFRCRYCMPPEGLPWMKRSEIFDFEEIERVTRILVESGIQSIKVTGGEPLVRRNLATLIRMLRGISPKLDISLTTNGYLLAQHAEELAAAGMDRVTVSCDSLIKHRFKGMTLRDGLAEVLEGLRVAASHGLTPVKINTVVIKGVNDDEPASFAELARSTGYDVRFIEYMPLDAQDEWSRDDVVAGADIIAQIHEALPLEPDTDETPEPATPYRFADGAPGRVGIIPSVTEPFCDSCDRLRLTADGQLKACLFSVDETDLKTPLRLGSSDDEIAALARSCIASKWAGHRIGQPDFVRPSRSMSSVGG